MQMRWHWPPENSCGRLSRATSGSRPTASSASSTLWRRSAALPRFQMRSGAPTMSPTVRRGLSELIGSWKTIWICGRWARSFSPRAAVRS